MSVSLKVNRYLRDKEMDCIDHALGRPVDPMGETYRNYFNVDINSEWGREWRSNPHWELMGANGDSHSINFRVTQAGREALRDHLKQIADPRRIFTIHFWGHEIPVVAKSRGNARYSYWRDLTDGYPDITFKAFCKSARVTSAARPDQPHLMEGREP